MSDEFYTAADIDHEPRRDEDTVSDPYPSPYQSGREPSKHDGASGDLFPASLAEAYSPEWRRGGANVALPWVPGVAPDRREVFEASRVQSPNVHTLPRAVAVTAGGGGASRAKAVVVAAACGLVTLATAAMGLVDAAWSP